MRILFLLTQDLSSPSGLGRYYPLSKELVKKGHEVIIIGLHSNYRELVSRQLVCEGVKVHYVSQMHVLKEGNVKKYFSSPKLLLISLSATLKLILASIRLKPDIIHIAKPHPMNSIAGLILKVVTKAKLFLDMDDYESESGSFSRLWQKQIVRLFEDNIPKLADYITTNTYFNIQRLIEMGISPKKIYYLPNGVDKDRFSKPNFETIGKIRKKYNLDDKKVVLFVGSLSSPSHPVDLLIKAFSILTKTDLKIHLMIVGGGENYEQLKNLVDKLQISDHVSFEGRVPPDEVVNYYYLSDVSVDPVFDNEAAKGRCPLKLFESWICGVPFLSINVGDRKRLIGEPPAGFLVDEPNPEALANALHNLLRDEKLSDVYRRRGLLRVSCYHWDKIADGLIKFYGDCLKGKIL